MIDLIGANEQTATNQDEVLALMDIMHKDSEKRSNGICHLADIQIKGDGAIIAPYGEVSITRHAMESLLKRLEPPMPKSYAYKVDNAQLIYDVNYALNESEKAVGFVMEKNGGPPIIHGFMSNTFQPVSCFDLLTELIGLGNDVNRITYAPHMSRFLMTTDIAFEPKKGDISKAGLEIINSEIGWASLQSAFMLYRLICSNGAIIADETFAYRHSQLNRESTTILNTFIERIGDYQWQLEEDYKTVLNYMAENPVRILDMVPRARMRHDGKDENELMGLGGLQYLLKSTIGKENTNAIFEQYNDESSQYDIYNAITAAAKSYDIDKARRLERIGGSIITHNINLARAA